MNVHKYMIIPNENFQTNKNLFVMVNPKMYLN